MRELSLQGIVGAVSDEMLEMECKAHTFLCVNRQSLGLLKANKGGVEWRNDCTHQGGK